MKKEVLWRIRKICREQCGWDQRTSTAQHSLIQVEGFAMPWKRYSQQV